MSYRVINLPCRYDSFWDSITTKALSLTPAEVLCIGFIWHCIVVILFNLFKAILLSEENKNEPTCDLADIRKIYKVLLFRARVRSWFNRTKLSDEAFRKNWIRANSWMPENYNLFYILCFLGRVLRRLIVFGTLLGSFCVYFGIDNFTQFKTIQRGLWSYEIWRLIYTVFAQVGFTDDVLTSVLVIFAPSLCWLWLVFTLKTIVLCIKILSKFPKNLVVRIFVDLCIIVHGFLFFNVWRYLEFAYETFYQPLQSCFEFRFVKTDIGYKPYIYDSKHNPSFKLFGRMGNQLHLLDVGKDLSTNSTWLVMALLTVMGCILVYFFMIRSIYVRLAFLLIFGPRAAKFLYFIFVTCVNLSLWLVCLTQIGWIMTIASYALSFNSTVEFWFNMLIG